MNNSTIHITLMVLGVITIVILSVALATKKKCKSNEGFDSGLQKVTIPLVNGYFTPPKGKTLHGFSGFPGLVKVLMTTESELEVYFYTDIHGNLKFSHPLECFNPRFFNPRNGPNVKSIVAYVSNTTRNCSTESEFELNTASRPENSDVRSVKIYPNGVVGISNN